MLHDSRKKLFICLLFFFFSIYLNQFINQITMFKNIIDDKIVKKNLQEQKIFSSTFRYTHNNYNQREHNIKLLGKFLNSLN